MCRRVVVFGNEPLVTIRLHQACPLGGLNGRRVNIASLPFWTQTGSEMSNGFEEVGQSCVRRQSRIRRPTASLPPPLRFRTTTISPLAGEIPVRA